MSFPESSTRKSVSFSLPKDSDEVEIDGNEHVTVLNQTSSPTHPDEVEFDVNLGWKGFHTRGRVRTRKNLVPVLIVLSILFIVLAIIFVLIALDG